MLVSGLKNKVCQWSLVLTVGSAGCSATNRTAPTDIEIFEVGTPDAGSDLGPIPGPGAEEDGDGVVDGSDNCRERENTDQSDRDGDGWGDACDNCPIVANASQETVKCSPGGIGKDDSDGDKVLDGEDNCALVANFDQANSDGDLFGDGCDNCPSVANDDQANVDDDRLGDACDQDLSDEELCAEGSTRAEVLEPNLYFVFDTSGSMSDADIENLNSAVKQAAAGPDGSQNTQDDLVNHFNVGMATFPSRIGDACFLQPQERLGLAEDNSSQALIRVLPDEGSGGTPTAAALSGVRSRQLFVLPGETPSTRPAAIILMTDGEPNDCGGQASTVREAARFAAIDVPVYVIAYKIKGELLEQATEVATAGSVDRNNPQPPLEATDASGIGAAFSSIRSKVASCTFPFEAQSDANYERVEVLLHVGSTTKELSEGADGYQLDVATRTGELTGSACETFKANSETGSASVELRVACKAQCEPMTEVCDFRDNNCDGNVDEGCSTEPPEVCNGIDDDGDGKIDEGCPVGPI